MGLLDMPSLQEIMADQRRQQAFSGLTAAGMAMMGGAPPAQGLMAGLSQIQPTGSMDTLKTYAAYQQIQDAAREREEEDKRRTAQETYLAGTPQLAGPTPLTGGLTEKPSGGLMAGISPEERGLAAAVGPDAYFAAKAKQHFAAPKDPLLRDFKEGDRYVTKRFNRTTREWEPTGSEAPRYKPGTTVDLGGVVGEMGQMLTEAGASKRAVDLEDRRVATTQMAAQGAGLIQALNEGGDSAISWTGGTARGLGKLSSQGRALAKQVGFDLNLKKFTFGGDLATKSSGIKSRLLGLAVGLTKADQGSRPSDFDVQTSLDRLAASSGSSRTMAATIQTMLDEKMSDFAIDYRVRSGEDFDWNAELDRHGITFPEIPVEPEAVSDVTPEQATEELRRRGLIP